MKHDDNCAKYNYCKIPDCSAGACRYYESLQIIKYSKLCKRHTFCNFGYCWGVKCALWEGDMEKTCGNCRYKYIGDDNIDCSDVVGECVSHSKWASEVRDVEKGCVTCKYKWNIWENRPCIVKVGMCRNYDKWEPIEEESMVAGGTDKAKEPHQGHPINHTVTAESALSRQVGGSHYKDYVIQPYEFFLKNDITHEKAAIIRRILRYDHPTGKGMEDLQKIKHEVDLIIEIEGWE